MVKQVSLKVRWVPRLSLHTGQRSCQSAPFGGRDPAPLPGCLLYCCRGRAADEWGADLWSAPTAASLFIYVSGPAVEGKGLGLGLGVGGAVNRCCPVIVGEILCLSGHFLLPLNGDVASLMCTSELWWNWWSDWTGASVIKLSPFTFAGAVFQLRCCWSVCGYRSVFASTVSAAFVIMQSFSI